MAVDAALTISQAGTFARMSTTEGRQQKPSKSAKSKDDSKKQGRENKEC